MIYLSISDTDGVSVATALSQLRTLVSSSMTSTRGQLCVHLKESMKQILINVHVNDRGILEETYETWDVASIENKS